MDKEKFALYEKILLEENQKVNLTGITDHQEIRTKHFEDSLTLFPYIKEGDRVLDLGSGAGFPGLPLRIEKDFDLTLIDSVGKKVDFMNYAIETLGLEKAQALHIRAEDLAKTERRGYDLVVSRAVANLSTLLELTLPLVKRGGLVIAMKGPKADEEIQAAKNALKILGGEVEKVDRIDLEGNVRNNILIRKTKTTPKKYPRGRNLPRKSPL